MGNFPETQYPKYLSSFVLQCPPRIQLKFQHRKNWWWDKKPIIFTLSALLSVAFLAIINIYQLVNSIQNLPSSFNSLILSSINLIILVVASILNAIVQLFYPNSILRHRFSLLYLVVFFVFSNSQNSSSSQLVPY